MKIVHNVRKIVCVCLSGLLIAGTPTMTVSAAEQMVSGADARMYSTPHHIKCSMLDIMYGTSTSRVIHENPDGSPSKRTEEYAEYREDDTQDVPQTSMSSNEPSTRQEALDASMDAQLEEGGIGLFNPKTACTPAYSEENTTLVSNVAGDEVKTVVNTADASSGTDALNGHTSASVFEDMSEEDIVEMMGPMFTANEAESGIRASMAMAQFLVESGYGKAELPQNANNIFGMKKDLSGNTWSGSHWDGVSVYTKNTSEQAPDGHYYTVKADFRAYDCVEDCIRDFSAYLLGAEKDGEPRYPGIKDVKTYQEGINIVRAGGYCTSQTYITKIDDKVKEWNLTRFDLSSAEDSNLFLQSSSPRVIDATTKSTSSSASGRLIAIDAGHQQKGNNDKEPVGPGSSEMKAKVSGGTKGVSTGLAEYDLTLQVAKKLKTALESEGYEVLMIRDKNDVNISNAERAEMANKAGADAFIRLHANGSDNASANGVLTICQTKANPYNASLHDKSYKLSSCVLEDVVKSTGAKKERVWETDTMTGINWCQIPVTIVEMGYMTNADEDKKLASSEYQDKIVTGIVNGISDFFN